MTSTLFFSPSISAITNGPPFGKSYPTSYLPSGLEFVNATELRANFPTLLCLLVDRI